MIKHLVDELMNFWIPFMFDKRYGIRYKIANLIMGDRLRRNLGITLLMLDNLDGYLETYDLTDYASDKIESISSNLHDIMDKKHKTTSYDLLIRAYRRSIKKGVNTND